MENERQLKAQYDIKKFLLTYRFLTPAARAEFEGKIQLHLNTVDEKTRKLYTTLLACAKNNEEMESVFRKMKEASDD
jgi:hypothetical protein